MAEMGNARCSVSISAVLLGGGPLPKVIGQWGGSDGSEAQVAVLGVTRTIPRSAGDQSILGPPGLDILALCSPMSYPSGPDTLFRTIKIPLGISLGHQILSIQTWATTQ